MSPVTSQAPLKPALQELRGRFIVLEGIDGAGKTTLLQALCNMLNAKIPALAVDVADAVVEDIVLTAEPTTQTPTAADINAFLRQASTQTPRSIHSRSEARELAALYINDRRAHSKDIRSWQAAGKLILSARYDLSTYAYQGASFLSAAKQNDVFAEFHALHDYKSPHGCVVPDLTCLLTVPIDISTTRVKSRRESPHFYEQLPESFRTAVATTYARALNFLEQQNSRRFLVLNGTRPQQELVTELCKALVQLPPRA